MLIIQFEDKMIATRSASEILDEIRRMKGLGSDSALGEIFGVKQSTVSSWRARNSLPYEDIIDFCIREDISLDSLLLHQKPLIVEKMLVGEDRYLPLSVTIEIDDLFTTRLVRQLGKRSIDWLANMANMDVAKINDIMTGRELPTFEELDSIAQALNVTTSWLAERSPIASENWRYEFYKKDNNKKAFPSEIFRNYLVSAENFIESMQGLITVTPELKADIIAIACRVHMKETPNSVEANHELIRFLLMLPK
jgi:transcriptional regulator with XRE-family HTH domain